MNEINYLKTVSNNGFKIQDKYSNLIMPLNQENESPTITLTNEDIREFIIECYVQIGESYKKFKQNSVIDNRISKQRQFYSRCKDTYRNVACHESGHAAQTKAAATLFDPDKLERMYATAVSLESDIPCIAPVTDQDELHYQPTN